MPASHAIKAALSYDGFTDTNRLDSGVRPAGSRPSLPPRRERFVEGAFAGGAFFDGDDGAALVGIDQRHVEPGALLQELQIAGALGVDVGKADQEEAVGDLHRQRRQRRAARLLVRLHQDAWHIADTAAGEILRQDEGQFRGVARRQRTIGVAAERHRHLELAVGDLDVGAHGDVGLLVAGGLHRFGAPDHRADILLALGIGRILVIEDDALRHRRDVVLRRLADTIRNLRPRGRRALILRRFHDLWLRPEQAGDAVDERLAPEDAGADQEQHHAHRDRALERTWGGGARRLRLAIAWRADARARRRGLWRVAISLVHGVVAPGIGLVGI